MATAAEQAARLAGFKEHGAKRARLMAEEVFAHVCAEAAKAGQSGECGLSLEPVEDGLSICFSTTHLAYDPESEPAFSLRTALEDGDAAGLGPAPGQGLRQPGQAHPGGSPAPVVPGPAPKERGRGPALGPAGAQPAVRAEALPHPT